MQVLEDIIAGGTGGAFGVFLGVPFDTVKVRLQSLPNKFKTNYQTFVDTIKYEGVYALYKGSSSPIAAQFVICALAFAGESFAIRILENEENYKSPSLINSYLAGSFGGLVQCFALVPTDLIKCKLQVDTNISTINKNNNNTHHKGEFKGVIDCAKQIIKEEGVKGLFRGMIVTAIREVPSYGFYFLSYRYSKEQLFQYFESKKMTNSLDLSSIIAGGIAGSISWGVIYPVDVIKSIIQTSPINTPKHQLTTSYVAMNILKERGFLFFYKGLSITIFRAFPVNAATFYVYELLQKYFRQLHNK